MTHCFWCESLSFLFLLLLLPLLLLLQLLLPLDLAQELENMLLVSVNGVKARPFAVWYEPIAKLEPGGATRNCG